MRIRFAPRSDGDEARALGALRERIDAFWLVAADRITDHFGLETAVWSADGRTYALVTPGHPEDFTTVVHYVRTHTR